MKRKPIILFLIHEHTEQEKKMLGELETKEKIDGVQVLTNKSIVEYEVEAFRKELNEAKAQFAEIEKKFDAKLDKALKNISSQKPKATKKKNEKAK